MDSLVVFFMTGLDAKGKILTDRCHEKKRVGALHQQDVISDRKRSYLGNVFRLAGWTHGMFADPLEPFAAFLTVVFRHDPVFGEIDVRWSANTTHAPITSVLLIPHCIIYVLFTLSRAVLPSLARLYGSAPQKNDSPGAGLLFYTVTPKRLSRTRTSTPRQSPDTADDQRRKAVPEIGFARPRR